MPSLPIRSTPTPPTAAAGWFVTLPLAGLVAARLAGYDRQAFLAAANAATPIVYLPAYAALAVGAATRRRGLMALAGSVAVAHLVWTAPELRRASRVPPDPDSGERLRVVTSNVRFNSRDSSALGWELASSGADILFVQELNPRHLLMLKAAGTFDGYPYSYVDVRPGSFGSGIWSRHPISDAESWDVADHPIGRATIDVDGTAVRVFNVHTKAPARNRWIPIWEEQLEALAGELQGEQRPVIMAGDFNATYGHRQFRELLAAGLREAHIEVGRGLATTWPRRGYFFPPIFRLDHVLVSSGLDVLDVREGTGKGSDHRPVIADLRIRRPEHSAGRPVGSAQNR